MYRFRDGDFLLRHPSVGVLAIESAAGDGCVYSGQRIHRGDKPVRAKSEHCTCIQQGSKRVSSLDSLRPDAFVGPVRGPRIQPNLRPQPIGGLRKRNFSSTDAVRTKSRTQPIAGYQRPARNACPTTGSLILEFGRREGFPSTRGLAIAGVPPHLFSRGLLSACLDADGK
jgi:hypothetical protein